MGERELFLAALELRDPREIALYLERACAVDGALRARVEALLKSHKEAGSFLEEPATYDVDSPVDQPLFSDSNAVFSADGSRIVTSSRDKTAKLWDPTTGIEVLSLNGHTGVEWSASFSPDGSRIGTTSKYRTAKVWDATPISREILAPGTVE